MKAEADGNLYGSHSGDLPAGPDGYMSDQLVRIATPIDHEDRTGRLLEDCFVRLAVLLEPGITAHDVRECIPQGPEFDEIALVNAMSHLGYVSQSIRLSVADIDERLLPCLFVPPGVSEYSASTPWIINSVHSDGLRRTFRVFNSETGQWSNLDVSEPVTPLIGRAYFFRKLERNEAEVNRQLLADSGRSWVGNMIARFHSVFWQLAFLGLLLNVIALATPLFVMLVYDRVISTRNTDSMLMLCIGVGLAIVAEVVLRLMRTRLLAWLTARIHFIVGSEIFKRLMDLPPAISQRASVTAQLARIKSFESVRDFFSGPIFVSTLELPAIIIAIGILLFVSPVLALIPFLSAVVFLGLFYVLRHHVSTAIKAAATESSVVQRFCVEALQDREEIRASGLTNIWKNQFREISGREGEAQAHLLLLSSIGEHSAHALNVITGLVSLYVGVNLVWVGQLTTGMLVALMILIWRSVSPFYSLCAQVARFEQFRNSVRQINSLMKMETEAEARKASVRVPRLQGKIDFQNVGLRFNRDSGVVFYGLNARIKPGEVVGICGAMGSGKTSLLKMVQTLVHPHLGKIMIDGLNAQQLTARDLRRQIGYVPQKPNVFPGSVAENLRLVKPNATDEELWGALEAVNADSLVKAMPRGLKQPLTSHKRLSELIYRLAFARLILQDAQIILIDELPGNILNTGIGELLEDILCNRDSQRTVLFVSQRADLLRQADRVIRLRHGAIPLVATLDVILEGAK